MSKLLLSFPDGYTPNDSQVSILKGIESAISRGEKFIVANAPTGSGKSFIAPTLANYSNPVPDDFKDAVDDYSIFNSFDEDVTDPTRFDRFGVYALTITKSLQDQYKETFKYTGILKGQSNYQCNVDEEETVDTAPCLFTEGLKKKCWECNTCSYYNDRNAMLKSNFSALNYSMFFSLPDHLKRRQILVLDEASELEGQLVSQFTCEVDIPFLVKIGVPVKAIPSDKKSDIIKWLTDLHSKEQEKLGEYLKFFESVKKKDASFQKKKGEYSKLSIMSQSLDLLIDTYYDSQYILERIDNKVKFTPLKVDALSDYIFKFADHVVLLSATIIDPANFCKTLGIDSFEYIETESIFDPKKSPIYILAKQKINYKNLKDMLPKLAHQIEGILEEHVGDKGIIHTHTQFITDYVSNRVKSKRLLCREPGVNNEQLLETHIESSEDTVLVSPSMSYGVDLKGDLAKFQIILKAPWLPTKDLRVEQMMKIDKTWYSNKMLCTMVQATGRGTRAKSDECITYILDGSIFDAINRNQSKLPKYFMDRIQ